MKIAICSPNQNAYSETFIHAHKNLLKGTILFYNTGWIPRQLDSKSILPPGNWVNKLFRILFRKLNLIKYSDEEFGFYRSLKKEQPDVILAEYAICGAEIFAIAKELKIPLVIHCHGFDVSQKSTVELYKNKYREGFNYAHAVIAVSKQMCNKLKELGCPEEKIVYTCCGPDAEFFGLQPDFNNHVALAAGRFVEKKGPHFTLFAFAKALEKIPSAKLRMVGDGELLPLCKDISKALKIENLVTFTGSLNPKQIQQEMEDATFFVQHSRTSEDGDMEGTPVVILEAQAAGLPVVSTYHAGIPDIVIHNETGLLSTERDIDGMANQMISLFESKVLCERLGKNARERVKTHFTIEQHINTLQEVLKKAVS